MGKRLDNHDKGDIIIRFNLFLKELRRKNTYNKILNDKHGRKLSAQGLLDMFKHYIFEDTTISYRDNWKYLESINHQNLSKNFIDLNIQYLDMKADEFKRWVYTKKDSSAFNEDSIRTKKRDYLKSHIEDRKLISTVMIKLMADEGGKIDMKKIFLTIQHYEGEHNVFGYTVIGNDMMILYVKKDYSFSFKFR